MSSPGVPDEIRERVARIIYDEGGYCGDCSYDGWETCQLCRDTLLGYVDAIAADRDALIAMLGAEQVGWRWYETRPSPGWYFADEHPDWFPADPPHAVYRFTAQEDR